MKKFSRYARISLVILSATMLLGPLRVQAQNTESPEFDRDTLIAAAIEIMETTRYCALITLDKSGHPQVRTMDPFLPDKTMIVWLGTNMHSRKVSEIRNDSRVSLYYEAPNGSGYVVIQGNARITDDPDTIDKYWKQEWDAFYPDRDSTYTLIRVIPKKLEIISYRHGITGSSKTWTVPHIAF